MNKSLATRTALSLGLLLFFFAPVSHSDGLDSLRGGLSLERGDMAPTLSRYVDEATPLHTRSYVQQPPLMPHAPGEHQVDLRTNECLDCHSWTRYREEGATKVSRTHFQDREGRDRSNISSRYYNCNQCHVPQTEERPLVDNLFQPLETVVRGGR